MNFTVSFFFFFIKFPDRFHPTALPSPLYIPPFLLYFIQFHFRIDRSTYIYTNFSISCITLKFHPSFFFYHSILSLSPLVSSNRNVLKIRKRVCWPRLAKTSFVGNHVIRFTRLSSSTMSIR